MGSVLFVSFFCTEKIVLNSTALDRLGDIDKILKIEQRVLINTIAHVSSFFRFQSLNDFDRQVHTFERIPMHDTS